MNTTIILISVAVFLLLTLLLVIVLLVAKSKLVPSGNVKLTINGEKEAEVPIGGTLLNTLQSAQQRTTDGYFSFLLPIDGELDVA